MATGRRLESYQLILLRRPADAPAFDDGTVDRLQSEHVAFYDAQRTAGTVLTNGPVREQADQSLRGIGVFAMPTLDAARTLAKTDPMVMAGWLEVEAMTYLTAPGTLTGPGIPIVLED